MNDSLIDESHSVFFYSGDKYTKVCTVVESKCYVNAEQNFKKNQIVQECRCVPDCTSISYDVEISQAQAKYSTDDLALKGLDNESERYTQL